MLDPLTRRAFLRAASAAGAAWAAADLLDIERTLDAMVAERAPGPLSALTAAQAEAIDAVASRMIPSVDGRPGAHEAGAVAFIDRALATFNAPEKAFYENGLRDLDARATKRHPDTATFAALSASDQDAILHDIETTPFFQALRFDVIVGTFALPSWGGNRDFAGWHLLGLDHRPSFQPPFGYYDAAVNAAGEPR